MHVLCFIGGHQVNSVPTTLTPSLTTETASGSTYVETDIESSHLVEKDSVQQRVVSYICR